MYRGMKFNQNAQMTSRPPEEANKFNLAGRNSVTDLKTLKEKKKPTR